MTGADVWEAYWQDLSPAEREIELELMHQSDLVRQQKRPSRRHARRGRRR